MNNDDVVFHLRAAHKRVTGMAFRTQEEMRHYVGDRWQQLEAQHRLLLEEAKALDIAIERVGRNR